MEKTAEQAVHDCLWKMLTAKLHDKVYESRPMAEVGYPFADFDSFSSSFTGTKNGVLSQVGVDINLWDTEYKRKEVSEMGNGLFYESMGLREAFGYSVSLRISESTIRVIQDATVTPPLWRCMVHLEFNIGG